MHAESLTTMMVANVIIITNPYKAILTNGTLHDSLSSHVGVFPLLLASPNVRVHTEYDDDLVQNIVFSLNTRSLHRCNESILLLRMMSQPAPT